MNFQRKVNEKEKNILIQNFNLTIRKLVLVYVNTGCSD